MEDTLGVLEELIFSNFEEVLILVLMEDTLRDNKTYGNIDTCSLNPCFNGRYSQSSLVYY